QRARALAAAVADQLDKRSRGTQLEMAKSTQQFSLEQQEVYKQRLEDSETRLRAAQLRAGASLAAAQPAQGGVDVGKAQGLGQEAGAEVSDQRDKVAMLRRQLGGDVALAA